MKWVPKMIQNRCSVRITILVGDQDLLKFLESGFRNIIIYTEYVKKHMVTAFNVIYVDAPNISMSDISMVILVMVQGMGNIVVSHNLTITPDIERMMPLLRSPTLSRRWAWYFVRSELNWFVPTRTIYIFWNIYIIGDCIDQWPFSNI